MKLLAILLFSICSGFAQQPQEQTQPAPKPPQKPFELSTVEKLKGVESAHFDPALPPLFFAKWFKRLVRPAVPVYESRACDGSPTATLKRECVHVAAALEDGRIVTLKFAYDPEHKVFEYLSGSVDVTDPKSKQSSKNIKKLSELIPILRPDGQAP